MDVVSILNLLTIIANFTFSLSIVFVRFPPPLTIGFHTTSHKEAEHLGLCGVAMNIGGNKLDIIQGVVGQVGQGVPAVLSQRGHWAGLGVTDDNVLFVVCVLGLGLELKYGI